MTMDEVQGRSAVIATNDVRVTCFWEKAKSVVAPMQRCICRIFSSL